MIGRCIKIANTIEFVCVPDRCVYKSDNYKVYGCFVNASQYPNVKINKYGTATIVGDVQDLALGIEYEVVATEELDKRGYNYKVVNIRRPKPNSVESSRKFLYEIITPNQADTLLSVYPDIVNKIMKNKLDDVDLSKTSGIKEYTFNLIKQKVIENFKLADLVNEFDGLFTISMLKKMYAKYPSIEKLRSKIREKPYDCLCELSGVGFKTADSMLLEIDKTSKKKIEKGEKPILFFNFDLKTSYQRMKACVYYLLSENEGSGNTYLNVVDVRKQALSMAKDAALHLPAILKGDEGLYFDKENLRLALKTTYETEKYIADKLKEGLSIKNVWDIDVEKYRIVDGNALTDEQMGTAQMVCQHNIGVLRGNGGSGKSFSSQSVINMLKDNNKAFILLAPTGRAAKVLAGYTKNPASTIHRGLGYNPKEGWLHNKDNPLTVDAVVLDEFSMTDIFLFKRLLEAIDFNKTKLLVIGDDAQLASVGAGNILYDILNSNAVPVTTLTKIFRYGIGGLSTVATNVRNSEQYLDKTQSGVQIFGEDKAYTFIPSLQEKSVANLVALYKKLLSQGNAIEDILVLSSYNKGEYGTDTINKKIQQAVNGDEKHLVKFGETEFRLNDPVIQTVNNYKAVLYNGYYDPSPENETFIANGETGKIVEVLSSAIIVDFDGTKIYCDKAALVSLRLAYSISLHKSQGGQCKNIIVLSPKAHTYMLNSNLLYVGITRAKERCFHIGEITVVNRALKKKENFDRNTFLCDLLKEEKVG